MDSRFFSFRGSGIIQQTGTAVPDNESPPDKKEIADDDIYRPSEEVIDFSDAKTETKDVVQNIVDLADAKVIDRDDEGIMEFDEKGSTRSKKKKPKIKRVTTIRDYVKKIDEKKESSMDYISIDDDEPDKRVFDDNEEKKVEPKRELEEDEKEQDLPELGYISIDDEEEQSVVMPEADSKEPAASGDNKKKTINCPHCGEIIVIPSPRRPITLKCPGCKQKGTLRI